MPVPVVTGPVHANKHACMPCSCGRCAGCWGSVRSTALLFVTPQPGMWCAEARCAVCGATLCCAVQADCLPDPSSVFLYLEDHNIGRDHALFYEAYAAYLELKGNFSQADLVYQEGIKRCVPHSTNAAACCSMWHLTCALAGAARPGLCCWRSSVRLSRAVILLCASTVKRACWCCTAAVCMLPGLPSPWRGSSRSMRPSTNAWCVLLVPMLLCLGWWHAQPVCPQHLLLDLLANGFPRVRTSTSVLRCNRGCSATC